MTQSQFRHRIKQIVGIEPTGDMVERAIRLGELSDPIKRAGWRDFDETHVEEMLRYLRSHSRKLLRAEAMTSSDGVTHGTR